MPVVGSMNIDRIDFYLDRKLFPFQYSQPLLRILQLRNTRVSVFPKLEEFLVVVYGFTFLAYLLDLLIIVAPGGSSAVADP